SSTGVDVVRSTARLDRHRVRRTADRYAGDVVRVVARRLDLNTSKENDMAERHPAWVSGITDVEARLANAAMLASQSQQPADAVAGLRIRSGIRNAVGNPGGLTVGVNQVTVNPFQAVIQDPARP